VQFHLTRVFGFTAAELQLIHNAGRGGDKVEVEFASAPVKAMPGAWSRRRS
jgi:hypothetical protein